MLNDFWIIFWQRYDHVASTMIISGSVPKEVLGDGLKTIGLLIYHQIIRANDTSQKIGQWFAKTGEFNPGITPQLCSPNSVGCLRKYTTTSRRTMTIEVSVGTRRPVDGSARHPNSFKQTHLQPERTERCRFVTSFRRMTINRLFLVALQTSFTCASHVEFCSPRPKAPP